MIKQILKEIPLVYTLDSFYTEQQCSDIIKKTEELSYQLAPITMAKDTFVLNLEVRDNSRVILDDKQLAEDLFKELKDYLPATYLGWKLDSLNTRFRYYKYQDNQKFAKHYDGRYVESVEKKSFLTLLIYLSDDFIGGSTAFFTDDEVLQFHVVPTIGQVLVFDHHQLHSGEPVTSGTKYVLRTDVMYTYQYR